MALGPAPLLLGGAVASVAVAIAYAMTKKPAAEAPPGTLATLPPGSPASLAAVATIQANLDPSMPAPLQAAVANAVVQGTDTTSLATLAVKVQEQFPVAAAIVATRVQQLIAATAPTQGAPGDRTYTVVKGDSPTGIGRKLTGRTDAGMVRELAASNPAIATRINAGQLRIAEVLKIPSSWLGTPVPSDTPIVTSATYGVVAGDSPSKIAKKLTGDGSAAKVNELARANASKSARILKGQINVYNAKTGGGDLLVIPEAWRK